MRFVLFLDNRDGSVLVSVGCRLIYPRVASGLSTRHYTIWPVTETNSHPDVRSAVIASLTPAAVPDSGWFMCACTTDPGAAPVMSERTTAADALAPLSAPTLKPRGLSPSSLTIATPTSS